jgi:hypothetical protein
MLDIAQIVVSLGDTISSRIRNGPSNFYDIRVLHECIKALDAICFGQNPEIQGNAFFLCIFQFSSVLSINLSDVFLKQQTWDFVNRTVAALSVLALASQHSSDKNSFMKGHTPEDVLEVLLEWLRSLSLSDRTNRVMKVHFTGTH